MDLSEEDIWKNSFFKDNFSVDHCLSQYTIKSDLKTLRKELKDYANDLQQQMSEILKAETEAIVNLAEYLTNLSSKIEELSLPICQLKEEIGYLFQLIQSAQSNYNGAMDRVKNNFNKQNHIALTLAIISSAFYIENMLNSTQKNVFEDSVMLERIVNKYSFQRSYLNELHIMKPDTGGVLKKVEDQLLTLINKKFLISIKNNDIDVITKCLRMYDNLGKQIEAQKTFQIYIVKPALQPIFTECHLEQCNYDVNKIYQEVLVFMDNSMNVLFDVLKRNPELNSFNFVLNSFWTEFDKQSREGLPYITAPGNPELFQKRFSTTWQFLLIIAKKCGDENLIRENNSFLEHMKRFNLPVYFEIRFQQIAGRFEHDVLMNLNNQIYAGKNVLNCKLNMTVTFWDCLRKCFRNEVFIEHLSDHFLKFSMLLLSRYLKWIDKRLKDNEFENDENIEEFIMNALVDLKILKHLIVFDNTQNITTSIYAVIPDYLNPCMLKIFGNNKKSIEESSKSLASFLVKLKFDQSVKHLQNVGSIPRLYRRTNRSAPKDASSYMIEAVKPILSLKNKFHSSIKEVLDNILDEVITNITNRYLVLVQEVLRSVCKTEESLRRLKSRNFNTSDDPSSQTDTISDEMKIREQIKLDVIYFYEHLHIIGQLKARNAIQRLKSETS